MNARLRRIWFFILFDWGPSMEEMVRRKLAVLGLGGFVVDREGLWRKVSTGVFLDACSESSLANRSIVIFRHDHKQWSCGEDRERGPPNIRDNKDKASF
jgi:hypothetical protein